MAPAPSLTLAHHIGGHTVIVPTTTLGVAVELARDLASRGGFATVRDKGRLVFAIDHDGREVGPDVGMPSDMFRWHRIP